MSRSIQLAIKTALAVVALAYLVRVIDLSKIRDAIAAADPVWIWVAVALLPVNLLIEAWKWHRLLRSVYPNSRFAEAAGALLCGHSLGVFTPLRLGDYAGRAFYLPFRDKWEIAALTLAERLISMVCYVFVGVIALLYFIWSTSELSGTRWNLVLGVGVVSCLLALFLIGHPRFSHRVLVTIIPSRRVRKMLRFLTNLRKVDAYFLLGQSMLRYAVFGTQFVCLLLAFQPQVGVLELVVGVALVVFAQTAIPSFTLMDLGVREGAAVFFLGAFGVAQATSFNAAFLLFCINILGPAFLGLPFLAKLRLEIDAAVDSEAMDTSPAES